MSVSTNGQPRARRGEWHGDGADGSCPKCAGIGRLGIDTDTVETLYVPCDCPVEERTSWWRDGVRKEAERLVKVSHPVPANLTFESFDTGWPAQESARTSLRQALDLARSYAAHPASHWCLVLAGTYGCGKSHLGCAMTNWRRDPTNNVAGALFLVVPDLLDHMRAGYDVNTDGETFWRRFDHVRNSTFLVLDDYGADQPTPWAEEKMFQILNHRYRLHYPTVILTNAPDVDCFPSRVASRLSDGAIFHVITAGDYRRCKS